MRSIYRTVYTAQDKARGLPVIIKKVALSQRDEQSLVNEVRALSSANDFNIIRAHRPFLDASSLWIVMERVDVSTTEVIRANILTETHVALISRESCSGLAFLHAKGIIHRDLRSAHILINLNGEVKLGESHPAPFLVTGLMAL